MKTIKYKGYSPKHCEIERIEIKSVSFDSVCGMVEEIKGNVVGTMHGGSTFFDSPFHIYKNLINIEGEPLSDNEKELSAVQEQIIYQCKLAHGQGFAEDLQNNDKAYAIALGVIAIILAWITLS